jgi:hypothetical protein
MKKFLTVLGTIGLVGSQVGPLAGSISPKAGAIAGGVAGLALLLGKSILEFKQSGNSTGDTVQTPVK